MCLGGVGSVDHFGIIFLAFHVCVHAVYMCLCDPQRGYNGMSEGGEKKHKILKGVLYTAAVLALIACCAAGILYLAVRKSVGQKIEIPEGFEEEEVTRNVEPAADEGEEGAERAAADEEPAAFHNIALIGIDSRKNEIPKRANTDTIIIASINEKTGDIRLVSIYRDTLLDIGSTNSEDKDQFIFDKANSAYANGGMWQLVRMLEKNLDIGIMNQKLW